MQLNFHLDQWEIRRKLSECLTTPTRIQTTIIIMTLLTILICYACTVYVNCLRNAHLDYSQQWKENVTNV